MLVSCKNMGETSYHKLSQASRTQGRLAEDARWGGSGCSLFLFVDVGS